MACLGVPRGLERAPLAAIREIVCHDASPCDVGVPWTTALSGARSNLCAYPRKGVLLEVVKLLLIRVGEVLDGGFGNPAQWKDRRTLGHEELCLMHVLGFPVISSAVLKGGIG